MNDIDKILSKFQYGFSHQFTDPKGGLSQEETSAKLYSLLMDVIGEDEFVPVSATGIDLGRITGVTQRNELRQIQRTELNKLFNKEETIK